MRENEQHSDLEDGEIIDEAELEDISDCSLSDIVTIPEGLGDESDIDQLRKEALKSMNEKDKPVDEDTEEERYRLEALKSLLKNMELEQETPEVTAEPRKRKTKRKRKHESTHRQKKRKKSSVPVRESSAPLEPLAEIKETDDSTACHLNQERKMKDNPCRSWYPKCESALIVIPSVISVDSPSVPVKLDKSDDFLPLTVKSRKIVPFKPAKVNRTIIQPPTVGNGFKSVPFLNSTRFRKVSNHPLRKVTPTALVANKFPQRADRYKLVNRSKYVLKKPSTPQTNAIPSNSAKSKNKYSINRLKSKFPQINPKEFIIELDEEDSSKEEDSKDSDCCCGTNEVPENCTTISSTSDVSTGVRKTVAEQKPDLSEADRSSTSGEVMRNERNQTFTRSSESSTKIDEVECCPTAVLPSVKSNVTDTQPLCSEQEGNGVLRERNVDSLVTHVASDTTSRMTRNQHNEELPLKKFDESGTQALPRSTPDDYEASWYENLIGLRPGQKPLDADTSPGIKVGNATSSAMTNCSSILLAAETNLLKIREKLVSDLDQFDKLAKQNVLEIEKLHAMLKKLSLLRSMVLSVEGKIKLQEARVSTNTNCINSLFSGVKLRTEYCSKLKAICFRAGKTLIGPSYKPPDDFEELISKKQKVIDSLKYVTPETK